MRFVTAKLKRCRDVRQGWLVRENPLIIVGQSGSTYLAEKYSEVSNPPDVDKFPEELDCGCSCHYSHKYGFVPEAGCPKHDIGDVPKPSDKPAARQEVKTCEFCLEDFPRRGLSNYHWNAKKYCCVTCRDMAHAARHAANKISKKIREMKAELDVLNKKIEKRRKLL